MGIDPNNLTDDHGIDYGEQTRNHTLINRAYSIDNPKKYKGYGEKAWGLTAGDSVKGYVAHSPEDDRGVIQPTAALSSMPYTPSFSMQALRYFYEEKGEKLWSNYGFVDGFSEAVRLVCEVASRHRPGPDHRHDRKLSHRAAVEDVHEHPRNSARHEGARVRPRPISPRDWTAECPSNSEWP